MIGPQEFAEAYNRVAPAAAHLTPEQGAFIHGKLMADPVLGALSLVAHVLSATEAERNAREAEIEHRRRAADDAVARLQAGQQQMAERLSGIMAGVGK